MFCKVLYVFVQEESRSVTIFARRKYHSVINWKATSVLVIYFKQNMDEVASQDYTYDCVCLSLSYLNSFIILYIYIYIIELLRAFPNHQNSLQVRKCVCWSNEVKSEMLVTSKSFEKIKFGNACSLIVYAICISHQLKLNYSILKRKFSNYLHVNVHQFLLVSRLLQKIIIIIIIIKKCFSH